MVCCVSSNLEQNDNCLTNHDKFVSNIIGVISSIAAAKFTLIGCAFLTLMVAPPSLGFGAAVLITLGTSIAVSIGVYYLARSVARYFMRHGSGSGQVDSPSSSDSSPSIARNTHMNQQPTTTQNIDAAINRQPTTTQNVDAEQLLQSSRDLSGKQAEFQRRSQNYFTNMTNDSEWRELLIPLLNTLNSSPGNQDPAAELDENYKGLLVVQVQLIEKSIEEFFTDLNTLKEQRAKRVLEFFQRRNLDFSNTNAVQQFRQVFEAECNRVDSEMSERLSQLISTFNEKKQEAATQHPNQERYLTLLNTYIDASEMVISRLHEFAQKDQRALIGAFFDQV